MKSSSIIGVVLILFGVVAFVYQGINYKSRDTVLDIGPLHATAEREHTLPLPPLVGIAAVAGGAILMVMGSRRTT
jgi:hypothetical protein